MLPHRARGSIIGEGVDSRAVLNFRFLVRVQGKPNEPSVCGIGVLVPDLSDRDKILTCPTAGHCKRLYV